MNRAVFLIIAILTLSLVWGSVHANQLYRYKDENGKTVLGRSVPPALVPKGYDILNERGRVIKTIPPALTPEQIAKRDAEKARQKALEEEQARQRERDYKLRQLYSHPNDAVRVLSRKLQDIEGVIALKNGKIDATKKKIVEKESKAANLQRNGINVPEHILKSITKLKMELADTQEDITELRQDITAVSEEFDAKIKRLEIITNKQATDYPALLQKLNTDTPPPSQS